MKRTPPMNSIKSFMDTMKIQTPVITVLSIATEDKTQLSSISRLIRKAWANPKSIIQ